LTNAEVDALVELVHDRTGLVAAGYYGHFDGEAETADER
jgi:hypothetical protein